MLHVIKLEVSLFPIGAVYRKPTDQAQSELILRLPVPNLGSMSAMYLKGPQYGLSADLLPSTRFQKFSLQATKFLKCQLPTRTLLLGLALLLADDTARVHYTKVRERNRASLSSCSIFSISYNRRYQILHSCLSDPLIHHGRHFGRTLHALCNIHSLITNGILRTIELDDDPELEHSFTTE